MVFSESFARRGKNLLLQRDQVHHTRLWQSVLAVGLDFEQLVHWTVAMQPRTLSTVIFLQFAKKILRSPCYEKISIKLEHCPTCLDRKFSPCLQDIGKQYSLNSNGITQ